MAKVKMTKEIGDFFKEKRIKIGLSSKDLAAQISKSPAYITKLESAGIMVLDFDIAVQILKSLFPIDKDFDEAYEFFVKNFNVEFSEEDKQSHESILNFDTVFRKIPLPIELVEYIKNELAELNYSIPMIVELVNKNIDAPELTDIKEPKKNHWYFSKGQSIIYIELDSDDLEKKLNDPNPICNYVTIQSVLINIFKLKGQEYTEAQKSSVQIMNKYKFYSLNEKGKLLQNTVSKEDRKNLLSEIDNRNASLVNSLLKYIHLFSDINVEYANERLSALDKNFEFDAGLTFAFLGIDLAPLNGLDKKEKTDFLKSIKTLIEDYSIKSKQPDTTLYKI